MKNLQKLEKQVAKIYQNQTDPQTRLCTILSIVRTAINQLKTTTFTGEKEEINFFKNILPPYWALLIYTQKFHYFQNDFPTDPAAIKTYCRAQVAQAQQFYHGHAAHYDYYKKGNTAHELDHLYFLNRPGNHSVLLPPNATQDPFSAPCTYLWAKFLAYERICADCRKYLAEPQSPPKFRTLVNLSLNQVGLFFRAADHAGLLVTDHNFSGLMRHIIPWLATPEAPRPSWASARTGLYRVSGNDKQTLINYLEDLIRRIKEL